MASFWDKPAAQQTRGSPSTTTKKSGERDDFTNLLVGQLASKAMTASRSSAPFDTPPRQQPGTPPFGRLHTYFLKEAACLASKVHTHLPRLHNGLLLFPSLLHRNVNKIQPRWPPHKTNNPLPLPATLLLGDQRLPKSEENGHIQPYKESTRRPERSYSEKKT